MPAYIDSSISNDHIPTSRFDAVYIQKVCIKKVCIKESIYNKNKSKNYYINYLRSNQLYIILITDDIYYIYDQYIYTYANISILYYFLDTNLAK